MSAIAIKVDSVSKKYRIGKIEKKADTFAESIVNGLKRPLTNLRQIQRLAQTDKDIDSVSWALRNVSFEVQAGEVLGIIGHNGAGKSTLLKILSRITEPSSGLIRIYGRVAALLEVGTGFHAELTGRENIYMNGTILGMRTREIDQKLDEIVDFSGVEKYLDTPVKFYSSGMRVRLGFSVAAHLDPEILIIDEVLAVGDLEFQKKCMGRLDKISKTGGRTVLFVSHNMHAVSELCQRALVLDKGEITFNGPTDEAIHRYTLSSDVITSQWISKSRSPKTGAKEFVAIAGQLRGHQPGLQLNIHFQVQHNDSNDDCFVAFDVVNSLGDAIMQALPSIEKNIARAKGDFYRCTIDLSGLVPGIYYVTCWMGRHNSATDHLVSKAISFTVTNSPTPGRTYPHTLDHGCLVPFSVVDAIDPAEYYQDSGLLQP